MTQRTVAAILSKPPRFITALFVVMLWQGHALAQGDPVAPCVDGSRPPYAALDSAVTVQSWGHRQLSDGWSPPDCTGWPKRRYEQVVALSGRFRFAGSSDDLLARLGAVSTLRGIRYWSVTDGSWRMLIADARALDGGTTRQNRADFTPADMMSGAELYYAQDDSRSTSEVIYRMRLRWSEPDRLVLTIENVTPVRFLFLTLFDAGDLQTTYLLERLAPEIWGYYSLTGIGGSGGGLTKGHEASSINRAVAFYRHFVGLPTDQEPPVAR
jgi:hypothetical protein